uniref:uncharacterized protein n=1 Tax=Myxine glutinosa TaxID=7769 RepID=UPI00358E3826
MASYRRNRTENYTDKEKELFLSLVRSEIAVLEAGSGPEAGSGAGTGPCHGVSLCDKTAAWQRLARRYNMAIGNRGVQRAPWQLRSLWKRLKLRAKREMLVLNSPGSLPHHDPSIHHKQDTSPSVSPASPLVPPSSLALSSNPPGLVSPIITSIPSSIFPPYPVPSNSPSPMDSSGISTNSFAISASSPSPQSPMSQTPNGIKVESEDKKKACDNGRTDKGPSPSISSVISLSLSTQPQASSLPSGSLTVPAHPAPTLRSRPTTFGRFGGRGWGFVPGRGSDGERWGRMRREQLEGMGRVRTERRELESSLLEFAKREHAAKMENLKLERDLLQNEKELLEMKWELVALEREQFQRKWVYDGEWTGLNEGNGDNRGE